MSDKLVALTPSLHNRLRFLPNADYSFAKKTHFCPVLLSEVFAAALNYPIVFPLGDEVILPQMVLSVRPGVNPSVADDGQWVGSYLPRMFRHYPFTLVPDSSTGKGLVMFRENAVHFCDEGKLLYVKRGDNYAPSPLLNQIKAALTSFDAEAEKTSALCRLLQNAKVLRDAGIKLDVAGEQKTVRGFAAVDWQKVIELDDVTLANWTRNGLIQLCLLYTSPSPRDIIAHLVFRILL